MQSKMSSTGEKKPKTTKNRNIACLHLQFFLKLHLSSGFSFAIVLIFYLFFCIFWSNLVTPIIATVMMILIDYVSRGYAARLTKPDAVSLRLMMYYVSGLVRAALSWSVNWGTNGLVIVIVGFFIIQPLGAPEF